MSFYHSPKDPPIYKEILMQEDDKTHTFLNALPSKDEVH